MPGRATRRSSSASPTTSSTTRSIRRPWPSTWRRRSTTSSSRSRTARSSARSLRSCTGIPTGGRSSCTSTRWQSRRPISGGHRPVDARRELGLGRELGCREAWVGTEARQPAGHGALRKARGGGGGVRHVRVHAVGGPCRRRGLLRGRPNDTRRVCHLATLDGQMTLAASATWPWMVRSDASARGLRGSLGRRDPTPPRQHALRRACGCRRRTERLSDLGVVKAGEHGASSRCGRSGAMQR